MRIWWHHNARIYEGTPVEIVRQMQLQDVQNRHLTLGEYVTHLVHEARHWGFELKVAGDSDEQRANNLIAAMISVNLARPVGVL